MWIWYRVTHGVPQQQEYGVIIPFYTVSDPDLSMFEAPGRFELQEGGGVGYPVHDHNHTRK